MIQPQSFRNLILHCTEPFVIKHNLNWDVVKWSLNEWEDLLRNESLCFRCGRVSPSYDPQWEYLSTTETLSFRQFLLRANDPHSKSWLYFDYKYLKDCSALLQGLRNKVTWHHLGFPEINVEESTIWIGSKGAHTSCHFDTYGCNVVAQVFGRKLWILFPPDAPLKPIRIPYEESTVYSRLNLYSPQLDSFVNCNHRCVKVILEPGEILIIPSKWWHYVENLETAISINAWMPKPQDDFERLKESIVRFIVMQAVPSLTERQQSIVIHPNERNQIHIMDHNENWNLIRNCKLQWETNKVPQKEIVITETLRKEFNTCIETISPMPEEDFIHFLHSQRSRFGSATYDSTDCNEITELVHIFDRLVSPEAISTVMDQFL